MKRTINIIIRVLIKLVSAIIAGGLSYINGRYFLLGIEAERGYQAVGGEVFFIVLIFGALYYASVHILESLLDDVVDNPAHTLNI